ncbi:hypothetical protein [Streptomyces sp. NPDC048349]|uniref:hypothetical protein n=1 Tax=Streptomyces sp. NPDC048349 TaxID=3155486 RepID=UPI0034334CC4
MDWESWGAVPAGYDTGLLHAYSLTVPVPVTAARIRRTFAHILDTPAGRTGNWSLSHSCSKSPLSEDTPNSPPSWPAALSS